MFRQKDQYNYYSLEFQNERVQFKIMKDGAQRVISNNKIEKILSDTWYNVQLTVKETVFRANLAKETDAVNPNKYLMTKEVLRGEDAYFKNGYQSLLSDGTLGLFVDNYKIDHLDCWKDGFDENKAIHYRQPFSSRYIEMYQSDITLSWTQHKKENMKWEFVSNSFQRKKALRKDLPKDSQSYAPIILTDKELYQGWVGFDVYLINKTTKLSFVFFVQNDRTYVELVISKHQA